MFYFRSSKDKAYFLQKQKPAKFRWTQVYRKLNKKGSIESRTKRRRKAAKKVQRAVVGLDLNELNRVRRETPAARQERQDANVKELRARRQRAKDGAAKTAKAAAGSQQSRGFKARGTATKGR